MLNKTRILDVFGSSPVGKTEYEQKRARLPISTPSDCGTIECIATLYSIFNVALYELKLTALVADAMCRARATSAHVARNSYSKTIL